MMMEGVFVPSPVHMLKVATIAVLPQSQVWMMQTVGFQEAKMVESALISNQISLIA